MFASRMMKPVAKTSDSPTRPLPGSTLTRSAKRAGFIALAPTVAPRRSETAAISERGPDWDFTHISVVTPVVDQTPGAGPPAAPGAPPAFTPPVTVDRIDIISGPAGAVTGHPPISFHSFLLRASGGVVKSSEIAVRGPDLDAPGPFNNTETDGVSNVHQIHFHVDSGTSAALTPRREIQRSAWRGKGQERQYPPSHPLPPGRAGPPATGGFGGVLVGRDGPRSNEVRRPSRDLLSVADAPGTEGLDADDCPFIYRAHFSVTVADPEGVDVARAKYDVRIEKRTPTEVPNTENAITPVEKLDLVRRRSLP